MTLEFHFKEYEQINECLHTIEEQRKKIESLCELCELCEIPSIGASSNVICPIIDVVSKSTTRIKKLLDSVKHSLSPNESLLYERYVRQSCQTLASFQTELTQYKTFESNTAKRQLRYLDISEEKIDAIVDQNRTSEVLREFLIGEDLDRVVEQIELRHNQIVTLDQSVRELKSLFMDMAFLVEEKSEVLNSIEYRMNLSKEITADATENLHTSEKIQKRTKKCQCCILIIILTILLVLILVPTLMLKH